MADSPYTIEEFTASDGYRCSYRRYWPSGAPRAHVVALHGIQSHAGWYEHSCSRLAQAGFCVSFLDRRGSGMNQQDRGHTPSSRRLLDDVAEFVQQVRSADCGIRDESAISPLRIFLLGISWGGKLAVALDHRYPYLVNGVILLCPGLFPKIQLLWPQQLDIFFSGLLRPRKLYSIPLNDPELFTQTPRWLEFLRADPLALHQATARFLFASARLDREVRKAMKHVKVPLLLLLAERDRIIDNARTRRFVADLRPGDRRIIEYPGAHHTLEFEPDPERFVADIAAWLDDHLP